jgi:hypothetical protein
MTNDNFPNVDQAAVVVLRCEGSDTAYQTLHEALIAWDRLAERSKDGATIISRGIIYGASEINRMNFVEGPS